MGTKISQLSADTSLDGTERLVGVDGATTKTVTTALLAAYAIDCLAAATEADPAAGDKLAMFRSGTEKRLDLDDVAAYAVASGWTTAVVAEAASSSDLLLVKRSGSIYSVDIDLLVTYALSGAQGGILNISGLSAATLAGTDQYLVVQGSTAKKTTLADLETKLWADTVTHVAGLSAVTVATDTDVLHVIQGGTEKYVTPAVLATYFASKIGGSILDSAWDADEAAAAASGDMLVLQRSGVMKTMDVDAVAAYAVETLGASSAVDPIAAGDDFVLFRSGVAKTGDVDDLATYVLASAWSSEAVTSVVTGDTVYLGRAGAGKQITVANLKTHILNGIQATVLDISALSAATLGASDEYLVCQSGVAKKATLSSLETKLWADFATYAAGLSDAATVVDADKFYLLHAGSPKYCTASEIATYLAAELWDAATASAAVTGDTVLINHSGTMQELTVDLLATYVNASAQATVLDISGLGSATIGSTDLMLFCQSGTGRQATVADLTDYVHDAFVTYLTALTAVGSSTDADVLYCVQGGAARKVTVESLSNHVLANAMTLPWTTVSAAKYTGTPASTSTLSMSDTSDLAVGRPIRYTYNSVTYYGIVTAIATNASITIAGAPLNLSYPVTALQVGIPEMVEQVDFSIQSVWDNAVQGILATVEERYFRWQKAKAHLVAFSAVQHWPDSGATQPYVNVKINGNLVSTDASTHGVLLSGTAGTWSDNSAVAISAANYTIERGQSVDLCCTVSGTNGDAECLTVSCVFVYE